VAQITIETRGRRHYLIGQTYPLREQLRAAGAHWDAEARAWWTGQRETAEALLSAEGEGEGEGDASQPQSAGDATVVAARATYRGRACYVAGRVVRGRTRYDDSVEAVTSRDGARVLLVSRDGARQWWAPIARHTASVVRVGDRPDTDGAEIGRTYDRPQTIRGLRRYAEDARAGFPGRPTCSTCGRPSCDGARGGLCEED